jgi:hypothetical protein
MGKKKKKKTRIPAPVFVLLGIFLLIATTTAGTSAGRHAASKAVTSIVNIVSSGSGDKAFVRAVLADLHAPETQANISSLEAWLPHESTKAAHNPMASTLKEPGSTTFNSIGVQNYVSSTQGAYATAATLANGYYPAIVKALRSGKGLCGNTSLAAEFLTWSGNGYSGVC